MAKTSEAFVLLTGQTFGIGFFLILIHEQTWPIAFISLTTISEMWKISL
jgi:hypothetical protein